MELNAVSENLNISKSCGLRIQHKKLFEYAKGLKGQIAHQYGLPKSRLDWNEVWHTVNSRLENTLLPELTNVIKQEKGRKVYDLEQNSRETKNPSNNIRFQHSKDESKSNQMRNIKA